MGSSDKRINPSYIHVSLIKANPRNKCIRLVIDKCENERKSS